MGIISAVIIGFFIGLLARFLMPGKDSAGFIITTLIGIVGAFIGTYLGQMMGWYAEGEPAGFAMSVFGAIILLFVHRMLTKRV